jgi:branched-chain amino acid transport system substrate-binding protein
MKHLAKIIGLLTVATIGSLVASGCALTKGGSEETSEGPHDTIKIGLVEMKTGSGTSYGEPNERGARIAVEEINAAGGVNGRNLELVIGDEKDEAADAATAVEKLISVDGVSVIIGPQKSAAVLAAAPIAEENEVVMITPDGTSPQISDAGNYIYRLCTRIDTQTNKLTEYTYTTLGLKKVAILYSNEPYGQGSAKLYRQDYEALGGQIVAEESFMIGDTDFSVQLTKIKDAAPEALAILGYFPETAPAAVQARQLGLNQPIIGVYGNMSPQYVTIGGQAVEGSVMAVEYDPSYSLPKSKDFKAKYEQYLSEHPNDPSNIMFAALAYDTVYLVADAMKANGTSADQVKAYLDTTKDWQGITGTMSFDANGDADKGDIILVKVENGQFVGI